MEARIDQKREEEVFSVPDDVHVATKILMKFCQGSLLVLEAQEVHGRLVGTRPSDQLDQSVEWVQVCGQKL